MEVWEIDYIEQVYMFNATKGIIIELLNDNDAESLNCMLYNYYLWK